MAGIVERRDGLVWRERPYITEPSEAARLARPLVEPIAPDRVGKPT